MTLAVILLLSTFSLSILEVPKIPNMKELRCMATNVYREARGEPMEGQIEVAKVVLARVEDGRWKDTACGVIYQPQQFSWTSKYKDVKYDMKSIDAAVLAYNSKDIKYTHYHAKSVKPSWRKRLKEGITIGNHIFYLP